MLVMMELSLVEFDTWGGATYAKEKILEANKWEEFENLIDEWFPNGIQEMELNDLLWFNDEEIFQELGMKGEDE